MMDRPLSAALRNLFRAHFVVALLFGLPLFLVPGRALTFVGWVAATVPLPDSSLTIPGSTFVDPILTRLLGAALLALALSSFYGRRAGRWVEVAMLVRLEAAFCVLGAVGVAGGLATIERQAPLVAWVTLAIVALFAAAWLWALRRPG